MKLYEFIERYGEGIPEDGIICDPSSKPELFFEAPSIDQIDGAKTGMSKLMYQNINLRRVDIKHGQTVYFPEGYALELDLGRRYLPMWEIYQTVNLNPDGKPLTIRYYRIEEVFPDDYSGDPSTIRREKIYE
ncbi:MAG: hypothetical protein WDA41_08775 [Candidatus Neomarinimicrobiota bacterium]|jgi:hypothetical protein